jgi:hypothetical protein
MIKFTLFAIAAAGFSACLLWAADPSGEGASSSGLVYEMRVYYAAEGKLDDLNARFRNHTMEIFTRHGITNVGYFMPEGENPERKLVYFLAYASREAREKSWKEFGADPEWKNVAKESEKNGRLVTKVESTFLQPTDYSPPLKIESRGGRVFELRTYTTPEGKLPELDARFRNYTIELFKKHGMQNMVYWHKMKGQRGADTTLVYMLGHKSREAGKKSFEEFRADPAWVKAKGDSEKNGSLTIPDGVKSEFLVPVDYSPLK